MKRLRWEAALVGLVALAATLAAAERTPLTWDEGDAFVRAERVAAWTRAVVVGPQKLKETFCVDEAESENGADFNVSAENAGNVGEKKDGATPGTALKSTQTASSNAEETKKEAEREQGERRERPRFGEVERAALEYFSRFDGRRALFSERAIEAGWPHVVYREGHPAGYSIAIASGRAFALRFLPFLSEKTAFRLGPIVLWATALAAIFYRVGRNWGRFAAILAVVGIASIPRVFGHAQLAGGDSLLISSWLLAWAFFDAALASKRGAVFLGGAVGVSFCAKFSGFAVVAPLAGGALATLWTRRRNGLRVLEETRKTRDEGKIGEMGETGRASQKERDAILAASGRFALAALVAAAVFFAANPPLWARPFAGFETFVSLNLRRDGFNVPIYFLGNIYSPSRPLPWWNGFFWLATTVPTALLAFAALGSVATTLGRIERNKKNRKNRGNGGDKENVENKEKGGVEVKEGDGESEGSGRDGGNRENGENERNRATEAIGTSCENDEDDESGRNGQVGENAETVGNAETVENAETVGNAETSENEGDANVDGERRRAAGLALAFAATLPLARIIPGIPTHDGARLIIASFPFIAILAALGATVFVDWCERRAATAFLGRARRRKAATLDALIVKIAKLERGSSIENESETRERIWGKWEEWREREEPKRRKKNARTARRSAQVVVLAAFAVGFVDLVRSAPQYLSFYNATLGGVVGAPRRGMEATYYWDAFDADAVAWLNAKIGAARAAGRPSGVLFGAFSSQTLDYYRRWGTLATSEIATISAPDAFANRGRFGFYVVQRRPSGWSTLDLALFKTARPIYRKTVGDPLDFRTKNGGRREVVLLEIYDFRDVERVLTSSARPQESGEEPSR